MVASAAALLGTRGVAETSFAEVISASGAPRGSIYHHFPRGKEELIAEAVRWTSAQIVRYQRSCRASTAAGIVDHFLALFRRSVESSACRAGCPVAAVVVGSYPGEDPWSAEVRSSFRAWVNVLTSQLAGVGVPRAKARSLATGTLAGVEGALILCRAERSVAPLDAVAGELRARAASFDRRPRPRGASRPGRK